MKTKSTPEPGDLRERALRLLARREHSRAELARKLGQAGFAQDEIEPLLDEFEEKKWLSDRRFAESYVADHRTRAGNVKLAYDLRQRGIGDNIIQAVLSENCGSEMGRAREVWRKKYGTLPTNTAETSKQIRFMQSRGFSLEIVRRVIDGRNEHD